MYSFDRQVQFKSRIRVSKYITDGDVTRMKVKYKKKKRPQRDLLKLTNQVSGSKLETFVNDFFRRWKKVSKQKEVQLKTRSVLGKGESAKKRSTSSSCAPKG